VSVTQMSQVWQFDLTHAEQSVLLALADHAHDDGTGCYPGVGYLAWKTGYSERQIRRILASLEAKGLIEPQGEKIGGRGHATEYHLHLEKGAKKSPYRPLMGDRLSEKGDIGGTKGDTAMSSQPGEPSTEPSVAAEPLPDDVTASCLLLLKKVEGFPRDQAKVALTIAGLRERFPDADPVRVCRDYEWKHRAGGMKSKNHLSRLRRFFETGHKYAGPHPERGNVTPIRGRRERTGGRAPEHAYAEEGY